MLGLVHARLVTHTKHAWTAAGTLVAWQRDPCLKMLVQKAGVSFPMFAARPYTAALHRFLYTKDTGARLPKPYQLFTSKLLFDMSHTELQSACMFTDSGGLAADYIIRRAPGKVFQGCCSVVLRLDVALAVPVWTALQACERSHCRIVISCCNWAAMCWLEDAALCAPQLASHYKRSSQFVTHASLR